ncbi:MAG: hypothetical protein E7069_07075 [Bacteroidales bacterium]|jgi:hypothetical protein|nr:hypothetical protein [Bacteroidales bacterium]
MRMKNDVDKMKQKAQRKDRRDMIQYINLQLASLGQPRYQDDEDAVTKLANAKFIDLTSDFINSFREKNRLIGKHYSPIDQRIQSFIDDYLKDVKTPEECQLPNETFVLNKKGLAREISLPPDSNSFFGKYVSTYRVAQGILNNPANDKRTTKGTFHIVEGGLPIPVDKKAVPKVTFARLLEAALHPSEELKTLPFTANQDEKAHVMVSLLVRPLVVPEVKGVMPAKSMEVHLFAPGSLVSSLDFVETIFGNAGDHNLAINDAALDIDHWTGHTGCIIFAPQLTQLKKKDLGLPYYDDATERQRIDGMCYHDENEIYNDGGSFKITCRDERGVVVTIIADNYFGYAKKEIKTQINYSANLYGLAEEEHSGGAIAFPRAIMSDDIYAETYSSKLDGIYTFEEAMQLLKDRVDIKPEGYAIDKKYPNIIYISEMANVLIGQTKITWMHNGQEKSIPLSPNKIYVHPSGNKFELAKHPQQSLWRIINTRPEGLLCHKPCTVSGGGKSEISKSMQNAIIYGPFNIVNIEEDFKLADEIINYDYTHRWKNDTPDAKPSRSFLSSRRALGSAVKLLTPSDLYNDEYNAFLRSIPAHIRSLVLFVKRLYRNESEKGNWKDYMSVEIINGRKGTTLMYKNKRVMGTYVRIGFNEDGNWLLHKLRSDFVPSQKIQVEDDITASVTIPASRLNNLNPIFKNPSVKIVDNCELHLFQRPDEAINRGYDHEAEADICKPGTFLTNYEPLTKADAQNLVEDAISFDLYTQPVKDLVHDFLESENDEFFVVPSHTRIVKGKPTNNPRYLQFNKNSAENEDTYVAEIGIRLHRKIKPEDPVVYVVNAVMPGRRNNPADKKAGIRPLSVYNPIHYQELPELFMDFICSLTGKSPSTTGAGSEGALTKGPFNMLCATSDLNNALLSYILCQYQGFSTAAGYVGNNRFDHDISILIPEIWARMVPEDRDANLLIKEGCLEKLEDFEYNGKIVEASRLGYRITKNFAFRCMNRLFDEPLAVFDEKMLKPELQDMEAFVDGINNIVEAERKVALRYFEEGSVEAAIPPLKALLHIMAYGNYEGKKVSDPEIRRMFERDYVLNSEWYKERLVLKQQRDLAHARQQLEYILEFRQRPENAVLLNDLRIDYKIAKLREQISRIESPAYIEALVGTIGADPLYTNK